MIAGALLVACAAAQPSDGALVRGRFELSGPFDGAVLRVGASELLWLDVHEPAGARELLDVPCGWRPGSERLTPALAALSPASTVPQTIELRRAAGPELPAELRTRAGPPAPRARAGVHPAAPFLLVAAALCALRARPRLAAGCALAFGALLGFGGARPGGGGEAWLIEALVEPDGASEVHLLRASSAAVEWSARAAPLALAIQPESATILWRARRGGGEERHGVQVVDGSVQAWFAIAAGLPPPPDPRGGSAWPGEPWPLPLDLWHRQPGGPFRSPASSAASAGGAPPGWLAAGLPARASVLLARLSQAPAFLAAEGPPPREVWLRVVSRAP